MLGFWRQLRFWVTDWFASAEHRRSVENELEDAIAEVGPGENGPAITERRVRELAEQKKRQDAATAWRDA